MSVQKTLKVNRSEANPATTGIAPLSCDTYAGTVHVEWDPHTPVTPIGQLVFFVQFLKSCDLFGSWAKDCPLTYNGGPRAPTNIDVLGTLLLAVLSGYKRYAHITSIRNDAVNPPLLGMRKVLSFEPGLGCRNRTGR